MSVYVLILFIKQATFGPITTALELAQRYTYEDCKSVASQFMELDSRVDVAFCLNTSTDKVHIIKR